MDTGAELRQWKRTCCVRRDQVYCLPSRVREREGGESGVGGRREWSGREERVSEWEGRGEWEGRVSDGE